MHFVTSKEKILSSVLIAERIVGKKESLPVLSCVVIDVDAECVVRATNLEAGIEVKVRGEIHEKGTVAVPVAVFSQTLRSIVGDKVSLKVEGGNLLIESRGTKTLIKAVPHAEFPTLSTAVKKDGLKISRASFIKGLQSVSYAASTSMIRAELGSVCVSFNEGVLVTVATDSFRLAEKTTQKAADDGEEEVLIPLKHVLELVHVLDHSTDEEVYVGADESQLVVRAEGLEFVSRIVDAAFPNYKEIVPKKFTTEATLLKSDFADMLRKARVFSGAEQRVGLHVYPKKKVFDATAQSALIGEMSDSLDAALTGDDLDINFHIGYLSDCLGTIESDSLVLGFSGVGRPLVIRGVSDTSFTYLVMPLNR